MSGYPGQKLVLRISLQLSGWRKETYLGCQDILDRYWCSRHLFSCQAGERRAFLRMSGYQDINRGSGHLFCCQAGERRAFLRMSGYPGQKLGLRTPLQLSGWRKESLTSDVRISWTESGAQDTSTAVRLAKGEPYFGC